MKINEDLWKRLTQQKQGLWKDKELQFAPTSTKILNHIRHYARTYECFAISFVGFISGMIIKDILFPPVYPPLQTIDFFGFRIASFIPGLLLVLIGIAWLIHGFGFIIVKR